MPQTTHTKELATLTIPTTAATSDELNLNGDNIVGIIPIGTESGGVYNGDSLADTFIEFQRSQYDEEGVALESPDTNWYRLAALDMTVVTLSDTAANKRGANIPPSSAAFLNLRRAKMRLAQASSPASAVSFVILSRIVK